MIEKLGITPIEIYKKTQEDYLPSHLHYIKWLENRYIEMLEALVDWNLSFKNTINYEKYEIPVFNLLNERYIQARKAIEKATGKTWKEIQERLKEK